MNEFINFLSKNWILVVIFGNFLVAASNIISKVIISGSISKPLDPAPYTFWSGFSGLITFFILLIINIWLGFLQFGLGAIGFGIFSGLVLILSLWMFYVALSRNEASRVLTLYVGGVPFFTFLIKYLFLKERLGGRPLLAFTFLIIGGVLVTFRQYEDGKLELKDMVLTVGGAFGVALGLVFADITFKVQGFAGQMAWKGFLSGFAWILAGYFLAALIVFLSARKKIITVDYATKANVFWFITEKMMGSGGLTLIKYAISLVGATFVNAFEGVKQFFILIIAAVLSRWYPGVLKEELEGAILWQKILAVIMIFIGIFLLIHAKQ